MHEGQQPRDLQENGTRSSSPQLRQQVRTKPSSKSPQPAKPQGSAFTNAGSGPVRSSQRSRNSARWRAAAPRLEAGELRPDLDLEVVPFVLAGLKFLHLHVDLITAGLIDRGRYFDGLADFAMAAVLARKDPAVCCGRSLSCWACIPSSL